MNHTEDDRSPTAKAFSKVSEITSISLMMIIPAIIGYFVDQRLGTLILFTAIGLIVGMSAAIWQLVKFVALENQKEQSQQEDSNG